MSVEKRKILRLIEKNLKITTEEIIDLMDNNDTWLILEILDELKEEGEIK